MTSNEETPTAAPPTRSLPIGTDNILSAEQVALFGVLNDQSPELAKMFVGAVAARAAITNPDHLSQACHSMRELIDNLPKYFDIPIDPPGRLGDLVSSLAAKWARQPRVRQSDDSPLTPAFVRALEEFFRKAAENKPRWRDAARTTLRHLGAAARPLPSPIEDLRADEWLVIRDFFVIGTHHGSCTGEDFDAYLGALQERMLGLAKPRTFDYQREIDALVREGEASPAAEDEPAPEVTDG